MKTILKILILITVFQFLCCQKKIFKVVKAHGRIIKFFTNIPVSIGVSLYGDDATTAKSSGQETVVLDRKNSDDDGTFHLKSHASRRDNYYLHVGDDLRNYIKLKEGEDTDLGDVSIGEFTFYCRVTILCSTGSSIRFFPGTFNIPDITFPSGTSTNFLHHLPYKYEDYEKYAHNYKLNFLVTSPSSITTYSFVDIPIVNGDTLYTTINY